MPSFRIDPSGQIAELCVNRDISLEADRAALGALAAAVEQDLPDDPRIVLLNKGQRCRGLEAAEWKYGPSENEQARRQYLPDYYGENDIIVHLLEGNEFTEPAVTASIARALAKRRQAAQNIAGIRRGLGVGTIGILLGGVAELGYHNHVVGITGVALSLGGVWAVINSSERVAAPLPDISELEPPIRFVPRPTRR